MLGKRRSGVSWLWRDIGGRKYASMADKGFAVEIWLQAIRNMCVVFAGKCIETSWPDVNLTEEQPQKIWAALCSRVMNVLGIDHLLPDSLRGLEVDPRHCRFLK